MDKTHKKTDLIIEEVEAAYDKFYRKKQAEIKQTVDSYFKQFERQDKKWRADVEKGVKTEAQYKAWRKSHLARGQAYKDMQAKVADELCNVNKTATQYVNDRLAEVYSINYNAVEGAANSLKGYSFQLVNEDVVRSLAENDSSFLPFKELDTEKDVAWNMRNVNNQVIQGIKKGESIPDIRKRLIDITGSNKAAAERTARTIITSAENKARQDSYEQMEKDGVIMKKRWISAHDARTRDWHAELDGQMVDVGDSFYNSFGEIEYPGDPHAHPANVYNCRCTLVAKIMGFKNTHLTSNDKNNIMGMTTQEDFQDNFGKNVDAAIHGNKDYRSELKKRYGDGTSTAKQAFEKYVQSDAIAETDYTGVGYFSSIDGKIHLNTKYDANDNVRGVGTQFFHEHGHYIDYHAGNISTSDSSFMVDLRSDFDNYLEKIQKSKGKSRYDAEKDLLDALRDERKHGISDIIDGLTNGRIVGCASHSTKNPLYWETSGAIEKETFAHMFESCFDSEKAKYMNEYFPNAYKNFKKMLKGTT